MGLLVALFLLAAAIVALVAYGGTPGTTGGSRCGPIDFFGHHFTLHADCRYVSLGELATGIGFFALAILAALAARPWR